MQPHHLNLNPASALHQTSLDICLPAPRLLSNLVATFCAGDKRQVVAHALCLVAPTVII